MNALLVVNKPTRLTSRDVVNELNHIFAIKKIGHTGTLDPLATGVLVCLIGKYTKLVDLITSYDKEYIAEIKLGIKTNTDDTTGKIIKKEQYSLTLDKIQEVLMNFPHVYEQQVPIYSAVKINGKKLHEYAREKIDIKLPTRKVNVYSLELISYKEDIITFKTKVSKGTYIRSLIQDICTNLNVIGTMNNLIRIKQGNFDIKDAYTLDDIKTGNYKLLNIKEFLDYPVIEINDYLVKKIINGNSIHNEYNIKDKVIFTYQSKDIAIYKVEHKDLKPLIML